MIRPSQPPQTARLDLASLRALADDLRRQADKIDAIIAIAESDSAAAVAVTSQSAFLSIAAVAKLRGKSKEAVRRQAKRRGIAEKLDGHLYIRSESVSHLYPEQSEKSERALSALSAPLSTLSIATPAR